MDDVQTPAVETTAPAPAPEAPAPEAPSKASSTPLSAWDSPEALEGDDWFKGLDEPRRGWLLNGIKTTYDRNGELETSLADTKAAHAAAKAEAERWLKMLEVANPDFKDLRSEVEELRGKAQAATEAAAELERLRAENASLAELRAAADSQKAAEAEAAQALAAVKAELETLRGDHDRFAAEQKTYVEGLVDHYGSSLERVVAAAFRQRFPEASDRQVEAALAAWSNAFREGDETPVEQQLAAAYAAMADTMPKPDAIPRSVTAMNMGGSRGTGTDLSDAELADRFYKSRGDSTGRKLAEELGLDHLKMMERISRATKRS